MVQDKQSILENLNKINTLFNCQNVAVCIIRTVL